MTSTAAAPDLDGAPAPEDELDPDDYGRTGEPHERAVEGRPYLQPARMVVLVALVAALGFSRGLPILFVILAVLVMIFLHELGHFVMARRAGMKVTEFMIGFGPRIFSFRRGEVEYGLKAIPLGAYVKIIGMANIEQVPVADEARTYRQKSFWQRFGVAVAGSTMHFLLALVLLFGGLVLAGDASSERWVVDSIAPSSAAQAAGIRAGDRVISIDGIPVAGFGDMTTAARKRPGRTVVVEVERDGRPMRLDARITSRVDLYGTRDVVQRLFEDEDGAIRPSVAAESTAERAGLRDGDRIVEINGVRIADLADLTEAAEVAKAGVMNITVERSGGESQHRLDFGTGVAVTEPEGFFGVGAGEDPWPVGPAAVEAVRQFGAISARSVVGVASFFNPASLVRFAERAVTTAPGERPVDSDRPLTLEQRRDALVEREGNRMGSIVGAVLAGESLAGSWGEFVVFLALLNIGIGIINLIPLPPFDGGHVAIAVYERIRELRRRDGKRYFADANKLMPVAYGVVMVMLVVGLMAIYLDLADPARL